jgi:hypothetical protein
MEDAMTPDMTIPYEREAMDLSYKISEVVRGIPLPIAEMAALLALVGIASDIGTREVPAYLLQPLMHRLDALMIAGRSSKASNTHRVDNVSVKKKRKMNLNMGDEPMDL